jgi:hypothetical protein
LAHQTTLKQVLRYLSGTRNYGITYTCVPEPFKFEGFADAAHKNRDDDKSTTGYVFIAAGGAITWRSGKQSVTATSSTEAEYIALWKGGKEISWLRNLYNELDQIQEQPTAIMSDSTRAVAIARDPIFHKRTKHIDSNFHWVREKIEAGRFYPIQIRDEEQTANVMTKPLHADKHRRHTKEMNISPV